MHYNKIAGVGCNLEVRILLLFSNVIGGVFWQCTKAVTGLGHSFGTCNVPLPYVIFLLLHGFVCREWDPGTVGTKMKDAQDTNARSQAD